MNSIQEPEIISYDQEELAAQTIFALVLVR